MVCFFFLVQKLTVLRTIRTVQVVKTGLGGRFIIDAHIWSTKTGIGNTFSKTGGKIVFRSRNSNGDDTNGRGS